MGERERTCPNCHRLVSLTPDGSLRAHNRSGHDRWQRCKGSGYRPRPTVRRMLGGQTGEAPIERNPAWRCDGMFDGVVDGYLSPEHRDVPPSCLGPIPEELPEGS